MRVEHFGIGALLSALPCVASWSAIIIRLHLIHSFFSAKISNLKYSLNSAHVSRFHILVAVKLPFLFWMSKLLWRGNFRDDVILPSLRPEFHLVFLSYSNFLIPVHTAISINVVGSKFKAVRHDFKILWIFLWISSSKSAMPCPSSDDIRRGAIWMKEMLGYQKEWGGSLFEDVLKL